MGSRGKAYLLALGLGLCLGLAPLAAVAQTALSLGPEDAVRAYRAAQVSRSAVRDQLALCAEDADKLDQLAARLRPERGADRSDWTDWGNLFRSIGGELHSCLRAYAKQILLHRRDLAILRERLPLLKEPKRLSVSPKLVAEINAYVAGLDKELASYAGQARELAGGAETAIGRAAAALRSAGVTGVEMPTGFGEGL